MSNDSVGVMPRGGSEWDAQWNAPSQVDEPRRTQAIAAPLNQAILPQSESDQVARDIAEIERVTATLRKLEPALQAWNDEPRASTRKPRSVWLIVCALWLSTALVTAGAVVAIAVLVG